MNHELDRANKGRYRRGLICVSDRKRLARLSSRPKLLLDCSTIFPHESTNGLAFRFRPQAKSTSQTATAFHMVTHLRSLFEVCSSIKRKSNEFIGAATPLGYLPDAHGAIVFLIPDISQDENHVAPHGKTH